MELSSADSSTSPWFDTLPDCLAAASSRILPADRARYVALLESIRESSDVGIEVVARGKDEWTVAVCFADYRGALSTVVGLLTSYRLTITRADIFTVGCPEPRRESVGRRSAATRQTRASAIRIPGRCILDIFDVRATGLLSPTLWDDFRTD